jgi:HEAT repeat protein
MTSPVRRYAALQVLMFSACLLCSVHVEAQASVPEIDALIASGKPDATLTLCNALEAGLPDALADRAAAGLGTLGHRSAYPTLLKLTQHRRARMRIAAYRALAGLHDREGLHVSQVIVSGLSDSDSAVRAVAATLLGALRDASQVAPLLRALSLGVLEAALSIGQLARADQVAAYHALLGHVALDAMLAGYDRLLRRADLDQASKLQIIAVLTEQPSPATAACLRAQLADAKLPQASPLRTAITVALSRMGAKATPQ